MARKEQLSTPDFSKIPATTAKELCRQGELCLQGTVQLAVAADQRATTLVGIFGAGSAALLAAAVSLSMNHSNKSSLIAAAMVTAFLLYCGALLCAWASRSTDFHVGGYEPRFLVMSVPQDEENLMRYVAEDVQTRISFNRDRLNNAAWYLNFGRVIALCAVPIGVITFFAMIRHFS
jgi:hypothetical protein